jgi:hypothetical protein
MHVRPDRVQLPQHPVVERRSINVSERAILRSACATGRRPERACLDGGLRDVPEVLSGLDTSDVLATRDGYNSHPRAWLWVHAAGAYHAARR